MKEMKELDIDDFIEDTMFCPHCTLQLYQKDDKRNIFLFVCRTCQYEYNLDYEFSLEKEKVNGISILPPVKQQVGGTCFLNAVLTTVESELMKGGTVTKEKYSGRLSMDDMIQKYEDRTGLKFGLESGQYNKRMTICRRILDEQGVVSTKGSGPYKAQLTWKNGVPFIDICELLTKRVLATNIPVTEKFRKLTPEDIYIADKSKIILENRIEESWHAIVLVGFGSKNNEKYFRFMNSWGKKFCDKGFGRIRALEIKNVLLCKLKI